MLNRWRLPTFVFDQCRVVQKLTSREIPSINKNVLEILIFEALLDVGGLVRDLDEDEEIGANGQMREGKSSPDLALTSL